MPTEADIAIVGGGCSGTLVAVQLVRKGFTGSVTIVEPRQKLGCGLAYSTEYDEHLLNVPAGKMSAFSDEPAHFVNWLSKTSQTEIAPASFVPRKLYGQYLGAMIKKELSGAGRHVQFNHLRVEAIAVEKDPAGVKIRLSDETCLTAKRVVLALGNPASSSILNAHIKDADRHYHASPWLGEALKVRFAGERILLIGTGLTAVDALLAVMSQELSAEVVMVSRRGLLPQVHASPASSANQIPVREREGERRTLRHLVSEVRRQVKEAKDCGGDWRPVIDTLRPHSNDLWQQLIPADQSRFLRHVKTYWEPHRHRMAPAIAAKTAEYFRNRGVRLIASRIRRISRVGDSLSVELSSRSSGESQIRVDRVINCAGLQENYGQSQRKLVASLIASGGAVANCHRIGMCTDSNGALLDGAGIPSPTLFTLGPPRRGDLFETTAVPEIRAQAERLAQHLIATFKG